MKPRKDSPAAPCSPRIGAGRSLALALGCVLAIWWPAAAAAQVVLELDKEGAGIWTTLVGAEWISIEGNHQARVIVPAEDGYVVAGDDLSSGDLFFLRRAGGQSAELPTPPSRTGDLRSSPVLVTADSRLEGAVWLEGSGPQEYGIFAAEWNGTSWENVETVSPQRTGPQLALSATVLEDGSWLVLWAGFDGSDDDIYWSRRRYGLWSEPRRLHPDNNVPDLLPAITARGATAHAAWNQFDGNDYRVRTARWNGSDWSVGPTLDGRGSGRPRFDVVEERSFLSFRTAAPDAWNLIEFEGFGAARTTTKAAPFMEPPLVVLGEDGAARMSWPWRHGIEQP